MKTKICCDAFEDHMSRMSHVTARVYYDADKNEIVTEAWEKMKPKKCCKEFEMVYPGLVKNPKSEWPSMEGYQIIYCPYCSTKIEPEKKRVRFKVNAFDVIDDNMKYPDYNIETLIEIGHAKVWIANDLLEEID